MPAVAGKVPVLRSDDVALRDTGIVEHTGEAVEQRLLSSESITRQRLRVLLLDHVRRDGGRKRKKTYILHIETAF